MGTIHFSSNITAPQTMPGTGEVSYFYTSPWYFLVRVDEVNGEAALFREGPVEEVYFIQGTPCVDVDSDDIEGIYWFILVPDGLPRDQYDTHLDRAVDSMGYQRAA